MNVARLIPRSVPHNAQLIRACQQWAYWPGVSGIHRRPGLQISQRWRWRLQHWPRRALSTSVQQQAQSDTIYALSTAPGRAAIAVIRISGPACLEVRLQLPIARPPSLTSFA